MVEGRGSSRLAGLTSCEPRGARGNRATAAEWVKRLVPVPRAVRRRRGPADRSRRRCEAHGRPGRESCARDFVAEGFEVTTSGAEEFLGGVPFLLAEGLRRLEPVGSGLFLGSDVEVGLGLVKPWRRV